MTNIVIAFFVCFTVTVCCTVVCGCWMICKALTEVFRPAVKAIEMNIEKIDESET